jgi:futalosine hydrolase
MQLLLTAATSLEITPVLQWLNDNFYPISDFHFQKEHLDIKVLITGVGIANTAASIGLILGKQNYNLVINAGICGSFNRYLQIGEVVNVISERFGDLGIEESDSSFKDIFEAGLAYPDQFPFTGELLANPAAEDFVFMKKASGLTVNKVHGNEKSIAHIRSKYSADIETMEGAAFFLVCLLAEVRFLEIRSVSNYVESRNRENWDIALAITNLNEMLIKMLQSLDN